MFELREHQREALGKMHNGCVLWGDVGTGKTFTALAYAMEKEPGCNVVVITTAKKRNTTDWIDQASVMRFPVDKIVVESWNKIQDFVDYEDHLFIFDEQRLVGTGAWSKAFQKIAKKNKWILLSATPGDTWGDYAPLFVANGWYKNITEFRRNHAVYSRYTTYPKIERYVNQKILEEYREKLLVEMPMLRHTTRHVEHLECEYDRESFRDVIKRRWNIFKDQPIENASELFGVLRRIVSTHPSRSDRFLEVLDNHEKVIVFYNFNYELDILRELCKEYQIRSCSGGLPPWDLSEEEIETFLNEDKKFGWSEYNGHRHDPIPDTERWVYLVQYTSGAEGWNCTKTDTMLFWSLTYSWKQYWQSQGRIDRLNTPFKDLFYYVMMANSPAEKPVLSALERKKDFQPRWKS